ncbi:hypothetical protein ACFLIM_29965 [Nonomuraea sp. M3C6]|uniref:Uncharacterized protein n=1 Tax=Nonomuraea marmarensis TaxID=3351344 RepID=A0ABW7AJ91_9ACTN
MEHDAGPALAGQISPDNAPALTLRDAKPSAEGRHDGQPSPTFSHLPLTTGTQDGSFTPPASFTATLTVVLNSQMPTVKTPPADLECKIALLTSSQTHEIASSRTGRRTLRKAMQRLRDERLIYTITNQGSFIGQRTEPTATKDKPTSDWARPSLDAEPCPGRQWTGSPAETAPSTGIS